MVTKKENETFLKIAIDRELINDFKMLVWLDGVRLNDAIASLMLREVEKRQMDLSEVKTLRAKRSNR